MKPQINLPQEPQETQTPRTAVFKRFNPCQPPGMLYGPSFDDGRGKYPAHIGMSAPRGMRAAIRQAAKALNITSAAFMRDAIEARLQAHISVRCGPHADGGAQHDVVS